MKMYLVLSHCADVGSEDVYTDVEAICATREVAEKYIDSYDPNVTWENDENPWIEGEPRSIFESEEILRRFLRKRCYGEEEEYFTIKEMEVFE